MKGYAGTTPTVDAIAKINFSGSCTVIPRLWREWLKRDSGKINSVAIDVLAEIVYWYRPIADIDGTTGKHLGWRRKFKSDKLQKSYEQLSSSLGHTKRQVKDAVTWLESRGFVSREFRTIGKCNNVLFIGVNAEAIAQITFQAPDTLSRSSDTPCDVPAGEGVTFKRQTYTETTPEITNKDYKNKENPLGSESHFSSFSDLGDGHNEWANHPINGQNSNLVDSQKDSMDGPKRKSSAKKKKVAPRKKQTPNEILGTFNERGYRNIPAKGKYADHGAVTLKLMQCYVISQVEGLVFDFVGDRVGVDVSDSRLGDFLPSSRLLPEDEFLSHLPMGKIQSLNDSPDYLFNFSIDEYNEQVLRYWNQVVRYAEQNGADALKSFCDGKMFFDIFRDCLAWTHRTYLAYNKAA